MSIEPTMPRKWRDKVNAREAWAAGYAHGLAQCNHHPEAMTNTAVDAIVNSTRITAHQGGVKAGRQIEQDQIGEALVLMAQEYGHAQFVFTREDLEALQSDTQQISDHLARIETLR